MAELQAIETFFPYSKDARLKLLGIVSPRVHA